MYSEISVNIVINVTNINNIYQQNIYLGNENNFILSDSPGLIQLHCDYLVSLVLTGFIQVNSYQSYLEQGRIGRNNICILRIWIATKQSVNYSVYEIQESFRLPNENVYVYQFRQRRFSQILFYYFEINIMAIEVRICEPVCKYNNIETDKKNKEGV